ncbi:MAG: hypothetical protein SFV23_23015 [Planctomycetaceae bacterium]|nr:hypothetical protein [Planctomycetaceae bacterium]
MSSTDEPSPPQDRPEVQESFAESAPVLPAPAPTAPPAPVLRLPSLTPSPLHRIGRYLFNHNPFYPLSAVLVLLGLHSLFHDEYAAQNLTQIGFNNGILWGVLAGYATLMAATAVWLVRWGRVWDDARTILLTLVLLLAAISVNCDKPIVLHLPAATWFLVGGLAFVLVLSEATLRLTRIALPWSLRAPMYLYFALFFLYPVLLDYTHNTIGDSNNALGLQETLLGVLLFPTVAGLITLSLIPAAMQGPNLARRITAAWTWPCYPWSLFVVLGVAVVMRAFYLTITFHPRAGTDSAFAPYFLTPFAMAIAAVIFELGRSVGHRFTQNLALAFPLLWLPMSLTDAPVRGAAGQFLQLHLQTIGSPMQVTLAGLLILYVYAMLRRGPEWLPSAVTALVCLAAVVGPHTVNADTFGPLNWQPLAAAAVLSGVRAIRQRTASLPWGLAATLGVFSLTVAGWDTSWTAYRFAAPIHLWLLSLLVIGVTLKDAAAKALLQVVGAAAVALAFGVTVYSARSYYGLSASLTMTYVSTWTIALWLAWSLNRGRDLLSAAALVSVAATLQSLVTTSAVLRSSSNPRAWALLLVGAISFAIGILVSARKMQTPREPDADSAPA